MKALPWIMAAAGIGVAAYVIVNAPEPQYAGGNGDIDRAANKTGAWGLKQRVSGTGSSVLGKVKEGFGRAMGDDTMQGEGLLDQAAGSVKDTAGKAAHAVSDTIHDLNRN